MSKRVVVTGIGTITPIGSGREKFWNNALAGCCGISSVTSFDTSAYRVHRGAEVKDFSPQDYIRKLDHKSIGRASQFAIAATKLALEDAGLDLSGIDPERSGVSVGTNTGEILVLEEFDRSYLKGEHREVAVANLRYPSYVLGMNVAAEFGLAGVNIVIPTACSAGSCAIAYAYDLLRSSKADLMVAGASDVFSSILFTGFAQLGAIAPEYCQPFDRNRKGIIPGEGAATLVLEPLASAIARNARIYAEIAGYGLSCDAYHMTGQHPQAEGAVQAMDKALRHSGMEPQGIDYISAHGTGTPSNDRLETIAIKRVFQKIAYHVPASSIKSMIGHTMGAASAIEAAVCALAIFDNKIPPTIYLEESDPECDLDYVPNSSRPHMVTAAMNNAYAFGGNNATMIFKKCEV